MRNIATLCFLITAVVFAKGQELYVKTFGNATHRAIIFLHGGPGYNCANFEVTTAQALADKGFFVIVYDRRGEGRSMASSAQYTFQEAFSDLNSIYQSYQLKKASLIGHSFGGVIATLFTEAYPDKVGKLILVSAPVSMQEALKHIIQKSKNIYTARKDSTNLNYIAILENMDTTSIEYSSYCLAHAMQNKFYSPRIPSDEARQIYTQFKTDTTLIKYASQSGFGAPMGFWKNEHYTSINLTKNLQNILNQKIKVYGLYGKEDGLFSEKQVNALKDMIGKKKLMYFDNCSHNLFIDQQSKFIEAIAAWLRKG